MELKERIVAELAPSALAPPHLVAPTLPVSTTIVKPVPTPSVAIPDSVVTPILPATTTTVSLVLPLDLTVVVRKIVAIRILVKEDTVVLVEQWASIVLHRISVVETLRV